MKFVILTILVISVAGIQGRARRQDAFPTPAAPTPPPMATSPPAMTSDAPAASVTTDAVPAITDAPNATVAMTTMAAPMTTPDAPMMPDNSSTAMTNVTSAPPVDTTDAAPADNMTTSSVPVVDNSDVTTTMAAPVDNDSTTQPTNISEPITPTPTVPSDCKTKEENEYYAKVDRFTSMPEFRELSDSEQIFIYEVMAAAEGCNMIGFITPKTSERVFRLLLDLPLRWVTTFVRLMDSTLTAEGVIVPT